MSAKIIFFEVQDWEHDIIAEAFPEAELHEEKLTAENAGTYADAEIVSCFVYSTLDAEALAKLPHLKLIATRSTGFDHIDLASCKEHQIIVSNVPEYGSNTVAEHTFALILSLTRKIYQSVNQAKQLDFDHSRIRGIDLHDKTLGIIGMGKIGVNVLRIAKGFGMKALVYNRSRDENLQQAYDFQYVGFDELLSQSDIITLHLPLVAETKHLINKENIGKIKKGSYLINTARGGLIETRALVEALQNGILEGVALDVLEEEKELSEEAAILTPRFQKEANMETLVMDHYLINHPKVLITPHNAFNSIEALQRIEKTTIENIQAYLSNSPQNSIS